MTHEPLPTTLPALREFQAMARDEQLWCLLEHGRLVRCNERSGLYRLGRLMVVVQLDEHPLHVASIVAYDVPSVR